MNDRKAGSNRAIQAERRRLLIDATMTAISEHGLQHLTLAKIAAIAGLSAGSVNFHFSSKEALLLETLSFLADEFGQTVDRAMANATEDPANRLLALLEGSLDPAVTEPRKMAVWYAFTAEARRREDYQRICGAQDRKIFDTTRQLCEDIIRQGGRGDAMDARAMASAVQGLVDDTWEDMLYAGDDYDRADARRTLQAFLASVFPWAFQLPPGPGGSRGRLSTQDGSLKIRRADRDDIPDLAALFDGYRRFYQLPSDTTLSRRFIGDNIRRERSLVLIARDREGAALGFTQLYPSWCSLAAAPLLTLYDLYVQAEARGSGVGKALMLAAEKTARRARACRIDLETGVDNRGAQALYESLGYQRDKAFYKYSLELDQAADKPAGAAP